MYTLDPTQLTVYFLRHAEDQIREESDAPGALAYHPQQGATLVAADRPEASARRRDRRRRRGRLCTRCARARSRRTQGTDPQEQRRPAEVPPGGVGEAATGEGLGVGITSPRVPHHISRSTTLSPRSSFRTLCTLASSRPARFRRSARAAFRRVPRRADTAPHLPARARVSD